MKFKLEVGMDAVKEAIEQAVGLWFRKDVRVLEVNPIATGTGDEERFLGFNVIVEEIEDVGLDEMVAETCDDLEDGIDEPSGLRHIPDDEEEPEEQEERHEQTSFEEEPEA